MYEKLFNIEKQEEMVSYFYNELSPKGDIHVIPKDHILDPEDARKIYIVIDGVLRQYVCDGKGREKEFYRLSKGTIFGEMDYFEGERTCIITKALEKSTVSIVSEEVLEEELRSNPKVYRYFIHSMTRKYRLMMMDSTENLFNDSLGRLVSLLMRIGIAQGSSLKDGIELKWGFTHEELSNRIGCSRITITKGMSKFKSEGLLSVQDKRIILKDIQGLMKYTNGIW